MEFTATVLSAAAAATAAVLAGINLYLTGRRERVRWNRQVLLETFGDFLDASFTSKDLVKAALEISWSPGGHERIPRLRDEAAAVEFDMRRMQTRLLLLTSPQVVSAAQALRTGVREYVALLDAVDQVSPEIDESVRAELWQLRDQFVAGAKKALAL